MLGTFLDKTTGLLDRSFLLAYWFPIFVSASLALLILCTWVWGWQATLMWWQQDLMLKGKDGGYYAQLLIVVEALVLITVLAYLFQPFTRTVIRFYEGYWPVTLRGWFISLPWLGEGNIWRDRSKKRAKAEEDRDWPTYNQLQVQLFYSYSSKEDRLMPTRLGNVLRAAEDYSKSAYGMDSVFWVAASLAAVARSGPKEYRRVSDPHDRPTELLIAGPAGVPGEPGLSRQGGAMVARVDGGWGRHCPSPGIISGCSFPGSELRGKDSVGCRPVPV
jgi:hypothetical protein